MARDELEPEEAARQNDSLLELPSTVETVPERPQRRPFEASKCIRTSLVLVGAVAVLIAAQKLFFSIAVAVDRARCPESHRTLPGEDIRALMPDASYILKPMVDRPQLLGDAQWALPSLRTYISVVQSLEALLHVGRSGSCPSRREVCAKCPYANAVCDNPFDIVVLNTYPNSGTTWTKAVFEAAAYASEAVYREADVRTSYDTYYDGHVRFHGAHQPAFVKSHHTAGGIVNWASRVVHYRRDPIDNIFARFHFEVKVGKASPIAHLLEHKRFEAYINDAHLALPPEVFAIWRDYALREAHIYVHWHCLSLIGYLDMPMLMVRYEDLLNRPAPEFARIFDFVGANVSTTALLRALKANPPFHAQNLYGVPAYLLSLPNFFTPDFFAELVETLHNVTQVFASNPAACQQVWHKWPETAASERDIVKMGMLT